MRLEARPIVGGVGEGPVAHRRGRESPGTSVERSSIVWSPGPEAGIPAQCRGLILGISAVDPAAASEARFPVVSGLEGDLFRDGESARVDGNDGFVELPGVAEIRVVTAFLQRPDEKVLLLRRSSRVGSFRERWAGVSGYLEDPTAEGQAYREIREETGLEPPEVRLVARGVQVYARDGERVYIVQPFRFRVERSEVRLDWEHTESEWVDPEEIYRRETVPKLDRAWETVSGTRSGPRSALGSTQR